MKGKTIFNWMIKFLVFKVFYKIFKKTNLISIFVLILRTFRDMLWFLDPGIQDSRSALELASFDWYQHVGYKSHSVYVKKLDFQLKISIFHHFWKIPEIFWNPGYCLEVAIFLPIWHIGRQFNLIFVTEHEFWFDEF